VCLPTGELKGCPAAMLMREGLVIKWCGNEDRLWKAIETSD
jgi:hypothetical protein